MNKTTRLSLGLMAVAGSATGVLQAAPALANTNSGPGLDATRNITINAASTFNNSYGTSFEATGDLEGSAVFSDPSNLASNLNSGMAFVSAMVSFDGGSGGITTAVSGLTSDVLDATAQPLNLADAGITVPGGTAVILGAVLPGDLTISGAGSSSTVAGSFIGTNIGTEALQVGGGLQEVITNQLSAF